MRKNALNPLAITLAHTYRLADLPFHHRDPCDRLRVAPALGEDLTLFSFFGPAGSYWQSAAE